MRGHHNKLYGCNVAKMSHITPFFYNSGRLCIFFNALLSINPVTTTAEDKSARGKDCNYGGKIFFNETLCNDPLVQQWT